MKDFVKSKLGQFVVASGWLGLLAAIGYMLATNQINLAIIEQIVKDAAPLFTAALAGGGVHFIWNKQSNGKNGGNGNGTPAVH